MYNKPSDVGDKVLRRDVPGVCASSLCRSNFEICRRWRAGCCQGGNFALGVLGNVPLMLSNWAPLSFLDVEQTDYALATLGVYEQLDVTLAMSCSNGPTAAK